MSEGNSVMTNYERTAQWLHACGKIPGHEGHLSVQIGVHFEECAELLDALNVVEHEGAQHLYVAANYLRKLSEKLKAGEWLATINDRVGCLDALCDTQVTGDGIAYLAQMKKVEADRRVLASNESKLVDGKPVILEGGKIGKGPNYAPPVLDDLV